MDSHQQNFLFSLSSGKPATEEVCDDLLRFSEIGEKATDTIHSISASGENSKIS